jgi:hypothetical protein
VKRSDLEHLIRAAATIVDDQEILVVGANAILGAHPNANERVTLSEVADLIPKNWPERQRLIAGTIGAAAPFRQAFGYCARGVELSVLVLPDGWRDRLVSIAVPRATNVTGYALDPNDLTISKLVAGRTQDVTFLQEVARAGFVAREVLLDRLAHTTAEDRLRTELRDRISAAFSAGGAV